MLTGTPSWNADFAKLWAGQTISLFGSQITLLALPLTAVLVLRATPFEMGILGAAASTPYLVFGLFAGAFVDRQERRRVLVSSDAGRAVLLATIPIAAIFGLLRLEQLYVVAFLCGGLTVFFDVAYMAALPGVVPRESLLAANSRLEVSRSLAQVAGQSVAGPLVGLLSAPGALLIDASSFVASAALVAFIRVRNCVCSRPLRRSTIWAEIGEGLRVLAANPILRSIAASSATTNLAGSALLSVYLLYLTQQLGLTPPQLGLIFSVGGISGVAGAILAGRIAQQFGVGVTLIIAILLSSAAALLIALAESLPFALLLVICAQGLMNFLLPVNNVNIISLRQSLTPDRLQGRVNASARFVAGIGMPVGALVGGALAEQFGLRSSIVAASLGLLLGAGCLAFSPVRRLRN
jgi:MFS family permease